MSAPVDGSAPHAPHASNASSVSHTPHVSHTPRGKKTRKKLQITPRTVPANRPGAVSSPEPTTAGSASERTAQRHAPSVSARAAWGPATKRAYEKLVLGLGDLDALQTLCDENGFTREQADAALEQAYRVMAEHLGRRNRDELLARAVLQRERIASRALDESDYRVALSAMDSRDKLLSLSRGENVQAAQTLLELLERAHAGAWPTADGGSGNSGGLADMDEDGAEGEA